MPEIAHPLARRLLFGNPGRARLKISPDGRWLSYLTPANGILNIAVTSASTPESPVIVSSSRRDVVDYFWLGTSRHVAFFSDRAGEEDHALHVVDIARCRTRILTPEHGAEARLAGLSWVRPETLAVAINDRNPTFHDICWVNVSSGALTRVLENERFSSLVLDRHLAPRLGIETHDDGSEIWHVRLGPDTWRILLRVGMDDAVATRPLGFSEDGSAIYLTDSRDSDTAKLCRLDLATGAHEVLAGDPSAEVETVKLHPITGAPQAAAFCRTQRLWQPITENVVPDFAMLAREIGEDFEIAAASSDDQRWIVESNSDVRPKQYFFLDRSTQTLTRLFTSRPELEKVRLARTTTEIVRSSDGLDLVVYLTGPNGRPAREGSPAVFLVHGGPWARDRLAYDGQRQWLADRGYLVVNVNFRGSTGLGKRYLAAGNRQWGGRMIEDLIEVAAWSVARGIAQQGRIGLMGMSFGGFAGLMALTRPETPFSCCVSLAGPPDLLALVRSLPERWKSQFSLFTRRVGDPKSAADRRLLQAHSPASHLDQLNGAVLIAHGMRDIRVPIDQVRAFADALAARGTPVTMVEYPNEGHGLVNQDNRLSYMALAEAFFATHLGGALEPIQEDLRRAEYIVRLGSEHIHPLGCITASAIASATRSDAWSCGS